MHPLTKLAFVITTCAAAAPAQSVCYDGNSHQVLGGAALRVVPSQDRLDIRSIGSSGQDGVSIDVGKVTGLRLDIGGLPSPSRLPTGAMVSVETLGTHGERWLVTMTRGLGGSLSLSGDFSGAGGSMYITADFLSQGQVIGSRTAANSRAVGVDFSAWFDRIESLEHNSRHGISLQWNNAISVNGIGSIDEVRVVGSVRVAIVIELTNLRAGGISSLHLSDEGINQNSGPVSVLGQAIGTPTDLRATLLAATGRSFTGFQGVAATRWRGMYVSVIADRSNLYHQLVELDLAGNFVGIYSQPISTQTSSIGMRDLATDGTHVYGGGESSIGTVFAFDTTTRTWDSSRSIPVGAVRGTVQALAFDPDGNRGLGSFFTCDGAGPITEFSRSGAILAVSPNPGASIFGAAYDPRSQTLWWWGMDNSGLGGIALETDRAGIATGQVFRGDQRIPGPLPGGVPAGMGFYRDVSGLARLVLLADATSDTLYEVQSQANYGHGCGGKVRFGGGPARAGNRNFRVHLDHCGGQSAFLLMSLHAAATPLPILPGFGEAGCLITIDFPATFTFAAAVSNCQASYQIPLASNLPNFRLYCQWAWLRGSGNLPLSFSTAGAFQIR